MRAKESTVATYCGPGNYLFKTYDTDDVIAERDFDTMCFTQMLNRSPEEKEKALLNKSLRFNEVYDEYVMGGACIEGVGSRSATV